MSAARAAVLVAGLHGAGGVSAGVLDAMVWERRVLVVLAPSMHDARTAETLRRLDSRACDTADRDLSVVLAPARGAGWIDGEPLDRAQAGALRARFRVDDADFAVVLIGKDGGEKLRVADPPVLDEVFALIDGMPMRRAEIRERGSSCRD